MLEKATIEIPCLICGRKNPKTIGWIKSNDAFMCNACNAIVAVKAEDVISSFYQGEQGGRNLLKSARVARRSLTRNCE